jgi:methylamine dehydrogenase accessory protein MauD
MTQALIVSNILLWIGLLALGVVVMALTRQIGLLHERLAPVGALATQRGPEVGEAAPELQLADLSGSPVVIGGGGQPQRTLLFFLSPTCPVCDTLLPTLRRVVAEESPGLRLVLASDGEPDEHRAFRREKGLEDLHYVLSTELGLRFAVAKLPTAVLIDEDGVVRAKGMVNTREHLESLFAAEELGVGSIQEFLERERPLATAAGAGVVS